MMLQRLISRQTRLLSTKRTRNDLRAVFDDVQYWNSRSRAHVGAAKGLFGMRTLSQPSDFLESSRQTINRCQTLVSRITAPDISDKDSLRVPKRMDMLSELICMVVDTAELIRNVHPDARWLEAADEAYMILARFMNKLNTNAQLYGALDRLLSDSRLSSQLNEEQKMVAELLRSDFLKYGVHMAARDRERVVGLNDNINALGHEFMRPSSDSPRTIFVSDLSKLEPLPRQEFESIKKRAVNGAVRLTLDQNLCDLIMKYVKDDELRHAAAQFGLTGAKRKMSLLRELLHNRFELARVLGHQDYATFFLQDKMAGTPATVMQFLDRRHELNVDLAKQQMNSLRRFIPSRAGSDANLRPYFSVGSVISGLSELFESVFGASIVPEPIRHGEVWHSGVRKLHVIHETRGRLGTIYCDLYDRQSAGALKSSSPAHFTVRCSRRIDDDDLDILPSSHYQDLETCGIQRDPATEHTHQLPIVVLVCGFQRPRPNSPTLLTFSDVETLCHEFGHALHSMLALTDHQHVSGTRCKLDWVEVPSILMEYFVRHPKFIGMYGRHYQTGAPVDEQAVRQHVEYRDRTSAVRAQEQLIYAVLDQVLHGNELAEHEFDIDRLSRGVYQKYSLNKTGVDISNFGHLFGYGAGYYSYTWSRSIARELFQHGFDDAFARQGIRAWRRSGEVLTNEVLQFGGGRDPWKMRWESLMDGKPLQEVILK